MNRQKLTWNEEHDALLAHMAQSREALREANVVAVIPTGRTQKVMASATGTALALANAPHVTLLLSLCVAAITLGPWRALRIFLRTGVSKWRAGNARRVASR